MSYTVPNWHLDDVSVPAGFDLRRSDLSATSDPGDVPSLFGCGMEELTWENGELIVNGLGTGPGPGLTRVSSKQSLNPYTTAEEEWERPRAAVGTLESIVDFATHKGPRWRPPAGKRDDIDVPLFNNPIRDRDPVSASSAAASVPSDMDALVPCAEQAPPGSTCAASGSTRVEVEDGSLRKKASPRATSVTGERSQSGGSESCHVLKADTCERGSGGFGLETASFCTQGRALSLSSTEKAASNTNTATTDHESACLTLPQGDTCGPKDDNKEVAKASLSTKRSRANSHNQSERKRREVINQKMMTLQKMVPNSNKTDKASMLDEVIDYLKQLQSQLHTVMMMNRMNIPTSMMMPFAMPQHPLHMPMMPQMGMDMGMNMNIINSAIMAQQNLAGLSPVMPTAPIMAHQNLAGLSQIMPTAPIMAHQNLAGLAPVMPTTPWDVTAKRPPSSSTMGPTGHCQSQPMTMESYNMMVALIQQQQQQPLASTTKN